MRPLFSALPITAAAGADQAWTRALVLAVVCVTALRVAGSIASPLDLHFDEAQYWAWSRSLEWGYFSKPPLVAWVIAATTGVFGDAEWAVRLAAAFGHAAASVVLFLLARKLYGAQAGFWAGLMWLLIPAVWLSSAVISTDALLLPIWAGALYALIRLVEAPSHSRAIALGFLIGLGALAKYAMLYFVGCAALAAVSAPSVRRALVSPYGASALAAALVVLAPNLFWNAANDFATIGHTAANANLQGDLFNPGEMIDFLVSQAAVIGPVTFGALGYLLFRAARGRKEASETDVILIAFILPPLIAISVQALVSRAHANWAASAYPAAIVWIAGQLAGTRVGRRWLAAAAVTNGALGLVFLSFTVWPSLADAAGASGAFKRARNWEAVCQQTLARTQGHGGPYSAVLVDHRALFFALTYYCRPEATGAALPPLKMWLLRAEAANHAAATAPMQATDGANVLVVHMSDGYVPVLWEDFERTRWLGAAEIALGGGESRWLGFSEASGFAPVTRDAAFEDRLRTRRDPPLPAAASPNP